MTNKKDHYVEVFMGTTYKIGRPKTVGQLKSVLEEIINDLPVDDELKISEVYLHQEELEYTLEEGIPQ